MHTESRTMCQSSRSKCISKRTETHSRRPIIWQFLHLVQIPVHTQRLDLILLLRTLELILVRMHLDLILCRVMSNLSFQSYLQKISRLMDSRTVATGREACPGRISCSKHRALNISCLTSLTIHSAKSVNSLICNNVASPEQGNVRKMDLMQSLLLSKNYPLTRSSSANLALTNRDCLQQATSVCTQSEIHIQGCR